ncbi:hypothetical protein MJ560_20120 [Klebsiella pneumoniae]|nr:hypothetical protein MJ560_20120 [Klebsiella pneumoniae]
MSFLPEGDEPRTVKAAAICAERGIATCVPLGNPDEINPRSRGPGRWSLAPALKSSIRKWFANAAWVAWSNCVRTKA